MRVPQLRTAAIVLAAGIGLSGCASYSPFGYGSGVSVGYGNSGYYDPYYGGYSGYGSRYGYGSGYGYSPYYGWNNGFYYPGSGYYVYDRWRRPFYWSDLQRRYWLERRHRSRTSSISQTIRDNWSGFHRDGRAGQRTTRIERSGISRPVVDRIRTSRIERRRESSSSSSEPVRSRRIERRSESSSASSEPVRSRRVTGRDRSGARPQ